MRLVEFLSGEFLGKYREQVFGLKWLLCSRIEWRQWLVYHVCLNVVPLCGNLFLCEEITLLLRTHSCLVLKFASILLHNSPQMYEFISNLKHFVKRIIR